MSNGCLCIISGQNGAKKQLSVISKEDGDKKAAFSEVFEYLFENYPNFQVRICDKEDFLLIEELFPNRFTLIPDRNNSDYVYDYEALSQMKGKKYHSKRNFVNRFENSYSFTYEEMTPSLAAECKELYLKWFREKEGSVPGLKEELEAVWELLDNWENLDITGGCIKSDGNMVSFSFGEPFIGRDDMAVIHLEHADTSYTGAFPMICKTFLSNSIKNIRYINREEDMGLEGLRKSKLSYYPCFMIEKYYAVHNFSESEI